MIDISGFGKVLIFFGAIMVLIGALLMFSGKVQWIGRLPGDIYIKKENFTFYFPLATSIILSIILSVIFLLIGKRR